MIRIEGTIRRTFTFPAELPLAFAYYSDLSRLLPYLPHISLARAYSYNQFRVLYDTVELGTYRIRIFCDLQAQLDGEKKILYVNPLNTGTPVKTQAKTRSTTAQGQFSSRSVFRDAGAKTEVEYRLRLRANLLPPLGLRFMPGAMVNRIADNITKRRMREIVEGFIQRSIHAFPHWLDEMGQ
ncbi:MAG: hypothetical protein PVF45_04025 [Anaerolineae bacterium]|jgi:hypothetical protein